MTAKELCAKLGIDQKRLKDWLARGLPWTGAARSKKFEPAAVRDWLVANKLAGQVTSTTEQPIARTIADVAKYFNVSSRTVATWTKEGMPGKPGRPGTQEGYFPLIEIDTWLGNRKVTKVAATDESKHQAQARLASARAEMIELELLTRRGELVDLAEVLKRWERLIHEAKSHGNQLPARVLKCLPAKSSSEVRKEVRKAVEATLHRMYLAMESFTQAEADVEPEATDEP